jgi:hypothetical protein
MLYDLLGGTLFYDAAVDEESHTVRDSACEVHLMCHDADSHSLFGKPPDDAMHILGKLGVQGACCFVKKHHTGVHAQSACDCDALLLAAGKLAGNLVGVLG